MDVPQEATPLSVSVSSTIKEDLYIEPQNGYLFSFSFRTSPTSAGRPARDRPPAGGKEGRKEGKVGRMGRGGGEGLTT